MVNKVTTDIKPEHPLVSANSFALFLGLEVIVVSPTSSIHEDLARCSFRVVEPESQKRVINIKSEFAFNFNSYKRSYKKQRLLHQLMSVEYQYFRIDFLYKNIT
ncbi:unnamed protein product [Clavelina lepadiformis]|uniref:Uncharacterized protein n=1 Tax=Clavelina lepadiformis TaxID=159417 RepID=A0ABP0F5E1_CLALP